MFGNTKNSGSETSQSPASKGINTLVIGTRVEGNITAQNDIRIDGTVEGILNCKGKLIIGQDGKVEGQAICQNAVIEGSFKGELTVQEILDVRENANVVGEIKTGKLNVASGAVFNGNCDMGQKIKSIPSNNSESHTTEANAS